MKSRTKKILIGGGILIGGLAIVVVALIISVVIWIARPTPLADSARFLVDDTTGYAQLVLSEDDPGTVRLLERMQAASGQGGPRSGEAPANVVTRQNLAGALPMVAAWTMAPSTTGTRRDLHVGMVSAPRFGRWLSLADGFFGLLGDGTGYTISDYANERIFDFDTPNFRGAVFVLEGTLFATTNTESARSAIDLLRTLPPDGSGATMPSPLGFLLGRTDSSAPLRGAVSNENGELVRLWETLNRGTLGNRLQLDNVEGVFVQGTLSEGGGLEAQGTIVAPGTNWTDVQISAIRSTVESMIESSFGDNEVSVERVGTDLVVTAVVPNIAEGIARFELR